MRSTAATCPPLRDEIGDLVFEAVFLAQLCAEDGHFSLADALAAAAAKLIRRHPHVFGEAAGDGCVDVRRREAQLGANQG